MNLPRDAIAFWGATFALILTYASSASPIPLYETWRAVDGLTYFDLSLSSVVYFAGAVTALIVFGRLSDFFGRKSIAIFAILLAATASVLFMFVHSALPMITGRLLQGLASGLASTAMTAWIVDTVKPERKHLPSLIISVSPLVGLSLGSLGGGSLITWAPYPRTLVFLIALAMIVCSIVWICFGQETVKSKPGFLGSMKPSFHLPKLGRPWYPIAAIVFTCTWSMGGFYQAYGPTIAAEYLNSTTAVAAAVVFASFMLPSVLGSTVANNMAATRAIVLGMLVFMVAITGVVASLYYGLLIPFLICSAFGGTAQGATMNGGIRCLMLGAKPEERASALSVIYGTAYTGAAVPTLVVGQLTSDFSLLQLASGYAGLGVVGFILTTMLVMVRKRTGDDQSVATEVNASSDDETLGDLEPERS